MSPDELKPIKITKKEPSIYEVRYSCATRGYRDNRAVSVMTTDVRRAITIAEYAIVNEGKTTNTKDVRILQVIHRGSAHYVDPMLILEEDEDVKDI